MDIPISIDPLYAYFLVFARVSAILMLMPAFGDSWVPMRARLLFALGFSALLSAVGFGADATTPTTFIDGVSVLIAETATGLVIGGAMRFFLAAPAVAGQITSQVTSLSNIFTASGMPMQTSSVLGAWFLMGVIAFIFVSGLHYLMLDAVALSYSLIPMGDFPNMGDTAQQAAHIFAGVFLLGVQMAAPFILLGIIFNLGVGLINKMQMTMPVYFIAMPISILGGFYVLAYAIGPVLTAFRGVFGAWLAAPFQ